MITKFIHTSIIGKFLRRFYRHFSDRKYIESAALVELGYKINLDDPKTFNEKMAWLKLYYHNPILHKLVDKYEVKNHVDHIIGEGHTAKVLGIYDSIDDIEFPSPPYVIKSTHYGVPIIIRNTEEFNIDEIKAILNKQAKCSGYTSHKEWGYKDVKPRIMIEEYLDDDSNNDCLQDYKFWCFNGVPKIIYLTVKNDNIYENFYDMNFNVIDVNHGYPRRKPEFKKPDNFEQMKNFACELSKGLPFVRLDFYNINGNIYFGEYTLFDWGGCHPFETYRQDLELGKLMSLPKEKWI